MEIQSRAFQPARALSAVSGDSVAERPIGARQPVLDPGPIWVFFRLVDTKSRSVNRESTVTLQRRS
jgi:hypothetical protein